MELEPSPSGWACANRSATARSVTVLSSSAASILGQSKQISTTVGDIGLTSRAGRDEVRMRFFANFLVLVFFSISSSAAYDEDVSGKKCEVEKVFPHLVIKFRFFHHDILLEISQLFDVKVLPNFIRSYSSYGIIFAYLNALDEGRVESKFLSGQRRKNLCALHNILNLLNLLYIVSLSVNIV